MSVIVYSVPAECQPLFSTLQKTGRNELTLSDKELEKIFGRRVFSRSLSNISVNRIFVNSPWGHDFSPTRHGVDSRGQLVSIARAPRQTPYIYFSLEGLKRLLADYEIKKEFEFSSMELNAFVEELFEVIKKNYASQYSLLFESDFSVQEFE